MTYREKAKELGISVSQAYYRENPDAMDRKRAYDRKYQENLFRVRVQPEPATA